MINQVALNIGTEYSHSVRNMSSRLLNIGTWVIIEKSENECRNVLKNKTNSKFIKKKQFVKLWNTSLFFKSYNYISSMQQQNTFLAREVKGFDPARSLNQASMAALDLGVTSQKLSLILICCFFLAVSGSWLHSAFFLRMALK